MNLIHSVKVDHTFMNSRLQIIIRKTDNSNNAFKRNSIKIGAPGNKWPAPLTARGPAFGDKNYYQAIGTGPQQHNWRLNGPAGLNSANDGEGGVFPQGVQPPYARENMSPREVNTTQYHFTNSLF